MRHIVSPVPRSLGRTSRQILAGESLGIASCEIALLGLAARSDEAEETDVSAERLILVLSGVAEVASAGEQISLTTGGYVFLPRGRSHCLGNPDAADALLLDIRAPVPSAVGSAPALARPLRELAGLLSPDAFAIHQAHRAEGRAFDTQPLTDRKRGAESLKVFAALVQPGSGMGLHIHPFDQFYFMLEGELAVQVGLLSGSVTKGQLVAFPAGTVHRNRNDAPTPALQITINAPEAGPSVVSAYDVALSEIKR